MSDIHFRQAHCRRAQGPIAAGRATHLQPVRRQDWAGLSAQDVLARYRIGRTPPLQVLEVLLELFNPLHTALEKTVSYKTRQQRAQFLRRFFHGLKAEAGFKTLPDPRNLGHKHIAAMVRVWQRDKLAPGTIQTYLSFLRGLAMWMGKHGFVRQPEHYGLELEEYRRTGLAERDKSWSAQGIDIEALVDRVCAYDRYVGGSLRLIRAMGLRRKESVMFRPHCNVVPFAATGLPPEGHVADRYARVKEGSKGGRLRFVPLDSPERLAAVQFAQSLAVGLDAHMGDPSRDLKKNLRRFDYVLEKFGITVRKLGVTAHGLRHEALIEHFESLTGQPPPVRGGEALLPEVDRAARLSVAKLAGHSRTRASGAYLGAVLAKRLPPNRGTDAPGDPPPPGPLGEAPPDAPAP